MAFYALHAALEQIPRNFASFYTELNADTRVFQHGNLQERGYQIGNLQVEPQSRAPSTKPPAKLHPATVDVPPAVAIHADIAPPLVPSNWRVLLKLNSVPDIEVGMRFAAMADAEAQLVNYARSHGYAFIVKERKRCGDGSIRAVKMVCDRAGITHGRDVRQRKNATKKCGCPAMAFISSNTITKYIGTHNHAPLGDDEILCDPSVKAAIIDTVGRPWVEGRLRAYTAANMNAANMRLALAHDVDVLNVLTSKDVSNLLDGLARVPGEKTKKVSSVDAACKLLRDNAANRDWVYDIYTENNRLERVVWLSPESRDLLETYGDVVLVDTTQKSNKYGMYLLVIAVVDSDGKTRLGASALINTEQAKSFAWVLDWLASKTRWRPTVVFSDGDLSLAQSFRGTSHFLCIWHILENLKKNCLKALREGYGVFISRFLMIRNTPTRDMFDQQWASFVDSQSPAVQHYLTRQLGGSKVEKWARAYMSNMFTIDLNTTSRVESLIGHVKRHLNSRSPIEEVIKQMERTQLDVSRKKISAAYRASLVDATTNEVHRQFELVGRALILEMKESTSLYAYARFSQELYLASTAYVVEQLVDEAKSMWRADA